MTTAGGLALITGAILKYAITWQSPWISLDVLGTTLICGGVLGLTLAAVRVSARRRGASRPYGCVREARTYGDDPLMYDDPRLYDGRQCDEHYYDDPHDAADPHGASRAYGAYDRDVHDARDVHW